MTTTARHLYDRWKEQAEPNGPTIEDVAMVELCHLEDDEFFAAVRDAEAMQAKDEGRVIRDSGWPIACATCGDEFAERYITDGVCGWCRNEADGLCGCGREPEPGFTMCGRCAAEEAGDVRFHANR